MIEDDSHGFEGPPSPTEVNLQDIIMERKAQRKLKAEEKRQLDMQRIKDMNSVTGIDPLEQCPKEIWEEILTALGPEDKGSMRQVHPLFSHLTESSKVSGIFLPQVLKLDKFHRCFSERDYSLPIEFQQEFRCVSKVARDYFDRWIDARFEKQLHDVMGYYCGFYNHVIINFNQHSDHLRLQSLIKAFGEGKNPAKRFFDRGFSVDFTEYDLDFDIPEGEEDQDQDEDEMFLEVRRVFRENIKAALKLIGDQIWHFRMIIGDDEATPLSFTEIYRLFQRLVSLLPNLKWLEFTIQGGEEAYPESGREENLEFLRENPFPHVASLERLTFHYDNDFPDSCCNEMLSAVIDANPQIKVLDVVDGKDAEIRGLPFHQIQSLQKVTSLTANHCNSLGFKFRLIKRMVNFNWPLKSIYVDLFMVRTPVNAVFRFLEKFPTLENVNLSQLKGPQIRDTDTWGYLQLPNMKDFHIAVGFPRIDYGSNIHFFFSLQFLLKCGRLEKFSWILYQFEENKLRNHLKERENPEEMIDFRAGLRFLHESNIWNVFPSLEYCKVDVRKKAYENEDVHLKNSWFCSHEYRRPCPGQKFTLSQFLKSHKCCRKENWLVHCVVLTE